MIALVYWISIYWNLYCLIGIRSFWSHSKLKYILQLFCLKIWFANFIFVSQYSELFDTKIGIKYVGAFSLYFPDSDSIKTISQSVSFEFWSFDHVLSKIENSKTVQRSVVNRAGYWNISWWFWWNFVGW